MEKKTLAEKMMAFLKKIAPLMSYRTKPGCPTCLTPIMDENGRPAVPHCSCTQEEE